MHRPYPWPLGARVFLHRCDLVQGWVVAVEATMAISVRFCCSEPDAEAMIAGREATDWYLLPEAKAELLRRGVAVQVGEWRRERRVWPLIWKAIKEHEEARVRGEEMAHA